MKRRVLALGFFSFWLFGSLGFGQTSYPMLMKLHPVAAQVGQTSEHELESRYNLHGATAVLITGEGVTGEIATPMDLKEGEPRPNLQKIKIKFHVSKNARPGVRDFRVMTPQGVSTLGQLVIARDPVAVEKEKNDTAPEAQEISLPATVCGLIDRAEDVDFYKFKVEAGTSLNFHVRSMRLEDKIHDLQQHVDPLIALRNSTGTTLATSDNMFAGDPFLSHRFEHAGEYFLEIRDVRYQGNRYWTYAIEINSRPFVTNVHPLGLAIGAETEVELVGTLLPAETKARITIPADQKPGLAEMTLPGELSTINSVPVVLTDLPAALETSSDNNTPEAAQKISVPAGISGRIESPADLDYFAFTAKKGERFSFEVIAHRQQSALDSSLRIVDAKGRRLTENDDLRLYKRTFSDSWIENWAAPADGEYYLEIGDLNLRGGADFVYFIEAKRAEPYFELYLDTDKTELTPGTSGVLFVNAVRKNGFEGDIALEIDGLPEGVKATCGRILAGQRDGCIVLEAPENVSNVAANVSVRGTAEYQAGEDKPVPLTATAVPYQETYQPGGGRGHWPVILHTVGVGEPGDIREVQLSEYDIHLKPGESKKIEVTIQRAEGFKNNVQLDLLYRHLNSVYADPLPPGITIDAKSSKTVLTNGATTGHITLKADAKAKKTEKQVTAVMANISINFVMKATYSSRPLTISVDE